MLFDLVAGAIESRSLARLSAYADRIATERFESGFDISEVQMAFNSLEVAMWRRVVAAVGLAAGAGRRDWLLRRPRPDSRCGPADAGPAVAAGRWR